MPDGEGCDAKLYRDAGSARDPALAGVGLVDDAGKSGARLVADQALEGSAREVEL